MYFSKVRDELMSSWLFLSCSLASITFWSSSAVEGTPHVIALFFDWKQHMMHTFPGVYALVLVTRVNYR